MKNKKNVVITGGNSGLGFAAASRIAAQSEAYHLVLACRDMQKAEQAVAAIVEETGNKAVSAMELDVASLDSVRAFAANFKERHASLYGLICNAGIVGSSVGASPEGFDIVFATNHLGHFLLTNLLLPIMETNGRVISVSSDMHSPPSGELTWYGVPAIAYPNEELGTLRYSYSKLCNLYFTYELARKLNVIHSDITANAFNPGLLTDTNFAKDKSRFTEAFLASVADRIGALPVSSQALADMILKEEYATMTGKFIDRGILTPSSPISYQTENAQELWNTSTAYTHLKKEEMLSGLGEA
ncbi:MAG: SDR family NAD(P)-dependent oxidoreductase [Christensenellaceae bacterium]|jgi:NAD(P)-dependent dehydrogenase (short-subunit alcohol dehydrogenase family)